VDSLVFMRIQGIDGEEPVGSDEGKGERPQKLIKIVTFDHTLTLPTSPLRPSVGKFAKLRRAYCQHGLFTVRKELDKTSHKIFELCLKGAVVENVAFYVCRPGENLKGEFGLEAMVSILLQEVVIVHFGYEWTTSWKERIDLDYSSITWKVDWPEGKEGKVNHLTPVGWNGLLNKSEAVDIPAGVAFKSS
jgi:type VI protein secretion system component Hcp